MTRELDRFPQYGGKFFGIVHVLMDQTISQLPHGYPVIGYIDQPEAIRAVQVINRAAYRLPCLRQKPWNQFVHDSVLEAAKTACECFQALGSIGIVRRTLYPARINRLAAGEQTLSRL